MGCYMPHNAEEAERIRRERTLSLDEQLERLRENELAYQWFDQWAKTAREMV